MLETSSLRGWLIKRGKREGSFVLQPNYLSHLSTTLNIVFFRIGTSWKENLHFISQDEQTIQENWNVKSGLVWLDESLSPWNTDSRLLTYGVFKAFRRNWDMNKKQVKCFQVLKKIERNNSYKGKEFHLQNELGAWKRFTISLTISS